MEDRSRTNIIYYPLIQKTLKGLFGLTRRKRCRKWRSHSFLHVFSTRGLFGRANKVEKKIGGGGNFLQYMFETGGVLRFSPTFTPHPNRLRNQNNPDHPINGLCSFSTKRPSSFITVHLVGHWSINQQSNSKNEHANQSVPEKKGKKKNQELKNETR